MALQSDGDETAAWPASNHVLKVQNTNPKQQEEETSPKCPRYMGFLKQMK
jgi:hypothetical protein